MLKSLLIVGSDRFFCPAFGDNCVKMNEDSFILSATKMFTRDSSFWQCMACVDIH